MFHRLSLTLSLLALTALTAQECCDMCGPDTIVVSAQHRFGRGVGYEHGYSSLDFFFAPAEQGCWGLPFFDVRGHVFDNGKWAANAGLGWRYLGPDSCWVWGANVYYDYRKSHQNNFNQVSFGLEALSTNWELRANGYIPVGLKRHSYRSHFSDFSFSGFSGNNILINQTEKRKFEQTMAGFDAEVGYHFWSSDCFDLYGGIGPYYFHGEHKHKNAFGGKARITAQITSYFTVEVSDTWDEVFHNRPQGLIALNLPFGPCAKVTRTNPDCCECPELLLDRLYQPVEKQEIIVLSDYKKRFDHTEVAIDPSTGLPWFVLFVNNTSTDPIGTFENPFNMLVQAQLGSSPGDIIYVFPGDGTTNGMNAGIILQDNQFFWGSGTTQALPTTEGVISILSQTANPPVITNTAGDGVDLAMNNEVVGFKILGANNNGIAGTDVGNVLITDNEILFSGNNGAAILATTGTSTITALRNTFLNNGLNGFGVGATGTSIVSLDFEQNSSRLNGSDGLFIGFDTASSVTALIKGNSLVENSDYGVQFEYADATSLVATIDSNTISNNLLDGITMFTSAPGQSAPTALALTVTNNTINSNSRNGISAGYTNNTTIQESIAGNSLSHNGSSAFLLFPNINSGASTQYVNDLTFTNNMMQANNDDGIFVEAENGPTGLGTGRVNLTALGNTITGNGENAVHILYRGASSTVATINNNLMNRNGSDAIFVQQVINGDPAPASMDLTATNNQMNENVNGIALNYTNNMLLNAFVDSNSINNNFNDGVLVNPALNIGIPANYQIDLTLTNNQLLSNLNRSISVTLLNGSSGSTGHATATVDNNAISFTSSFFNPQLNGTGDIDFDLTYTNNTLTDGASFSLQTQKFVAGPASATINATVSNNSISAPFSTGIRIEGDNFTATGSVAITATCENNTISNAFGNGISFVVDGPSTGANTMTAHVTGNQMVENAAVGFFAQTNHTNGSLCLILGNNNSTNGYQLTNTLGTFTLDNTGNNTGTPFNQGPGVVNGTCP